MSEHDDERRPRGMRMRPTEYPHILWNIDKDLPCISGTRLRVQDVVVLHHMGESIAEIVANFPPHSPAEICAALAYYYDHQDEMDELIEEHHRSARAWRAEVEAGRGPTKAQLLARAKIARS